MATKTVFICAVCGKESSGRTPKRGDGSERYPRRHNHNGVPCTGNIIHALWKDVPDKPADAPINKDLKAIEHFIYLANTIGVTPNERAAIVSLISKVATYFITTNPTQYHFSMTEYYE